MFISWIFPICSECLIFHPPQSRYSSATLLPLHSLSVPLTPLEYQVKADRDAIDLELHSAKVEREIAAFGETGWKKADWAD
jgi:hypothetical protein